MGEPAVVVSELSKRFRLYRERNQSLKAAIMRGGRARFEEFWALRDVSLEVEPGETYGLIGHNGSGKSTLLKCIARILRPDQGSVRTEGKMAALLELGAGFHEELSGRENVYLNGSILGMTQRDLDARFDAIVDFAGLERFIDQPVKNYSSGMYVRLGFSVAINVDPDILLVDEVLAVGDEQFQRKCNERFAQLREQGTTIVLVSHGLEVVRSMCDRVAWLEAGQLRAIGSSGEIVDQYLESVHDARDTEGDGSVRWGSQEIRVSRVQLLGPDGRPTSQVRTGDAAAIRLTLEARQPIDQPVVTVLVHTVEGQLVTAPSTRDAGVTLDGFEGERVVEIAIDRLPLLPGTFDLSTEVTDRGGLHVFDHRQHAMRFDVEIGTPHETGGGFLTLGGAWTIGVDR